MDTIKVQGKGNIRMIAHRGVSGLERENTNAAFVAAQVRAIFPVFCGISGSKRTIFIFFIKLSYYQLHIDRLYPSSFNSCTTTIVAVLISITSAFASFIIIFNLILKVGSFKHIYIHISYLPYHHRN